MPDEVTIKQNMCPVCVKPFDEKDIVVKFWEWHKEGEPSGPEWAHLDCALYLSKIENRNHPPG